MFERRRGFVHQFDVLGPDAGERVAVDIADHVHPADEFRHETVGRALVELDRTSDLLDPAAIHDDDPIGDFHRLVLVVGDHDRRDAEPELEVLDLRPQFLADLGVECREWFVQQQHRRLRRERARERNALLLSAGELVRRLVGLVGEVD